jgi:hypothetical protein
MRKHGNAKCILSLMMSRLGHCTDWLKYEHEITWIEYGKLLKNNNEKDEKMIQNNNMIIINF